MEGGSGGWVVWMLLLGSERGGYEAGQGWGCIDTIGVNGF